MNRFERWTLRSNAKQYGPTYNYGRTQALAVVCIAISTFITVMMWIRLDVLGSFIGGFALGISIIWLIAAVQGPTLRRYVDTDQMLIDLAADKEPKSHQRI